MESDKPLFSLNRKFYQIYADFINIPFNTTTRTITTLRATIYQNLAQFGFKEIIPNKKDGVCRFEDVIKLMSPETEIKFGYDGMNRLYIQVSCSNAKDFEAMFDHCREILEEWAKS